MLQEASRKFLSCGSPAWPAFQGTMDRNIIERERGIPGPWSTAFCSNGEPFLLEQRKEEKEGSERNVGECVQESVGLPFKNSLLLTSTNNTFIWVILLHCIKRELSCCGLVYKYIKKFTLFITPSCVILRKKLTISVIFYLLEVFIHRLRENQLHFRRWLLFLDTRFRWWFRMGQSSGSYLSSHEWSWIWSHIWQLVR